MSQSDKDPSRNRRNEPGCTPGQLILVFLLLGGELLLAVTVVALSAWAGGTIFGTTRGWIGGGLVAVSACLFVFQRFQQGESSFECGCIQVIIWPLGIALFFLF